MNTYGLIIRNLLHERGMTQKTLSDLTEIPKSTLNRILGDEGYMALEQAVAIAKALGVSLDVIAGIASPGADSATPERIADTAINAYTELIAERDKNIEYLNARLADKEQLIAAKNAIIALQQDVIEGLKRNRST